MDTHLLYELIGYLASILVALSLTMRSILRLRLINLLGAAFFTVYGLLITAYPVAILNGLIVGINLYYLYEMKRAKNYFTILETHYDAAYLRMFLRYYAEDIKRFFPSFSYAPTGRHLIWFILRDLVPVGLFIAETKGPDRLLIQLDYVMPGYRDLRPGTFIYHEQVERFKAQGIAYLEAIPETEAQRDYVRRMGFAPVTSASGEGEAVYSRTP